VSNLRDDLQRIYDKRGQLTPTLVLDEARDESHPLHNRFEWDDAIAGEAHRRTQAHELIRSVRVVYREADDKEGPRSVRVFHAVRSENGHVYEPLDKITGDELLSKVLLRDMEREWKQLMRRYGEFSEFLEMVRGDVSQEAA
jgi:hypothetical protein